MGHHVHALHGEAEGPEHGRLGEDEVEGQLLEQHQSPPGSARQHS